MGQKRIVDLSISIEPELPSDPPMMIPKIDYVDHEMGAGQMMEFFPGVKKEQLPKGLGWAVEFVHLTTHSGTHLDAPYHYHPTMDNGERALTIDEIPLEWCMSDGVLLDFSHKADGDRISVDDVKKELERIEYEIKPLDIVLVRTGADAAWGTPQYLVKGPGMDRESTLFLTEQGVKVVGIDAWSWDRPLPFLAEEFKRTGDPKGDLGSPFCRDRDRVLPYGEAGQPGGHRPAAWIYGLLLSGQNQGCQRGLVPASGDRAGGLIAHAMQEQ